MGEAKVRVSLVEGSLEIEGSETFVSALIDRFQEPIQSALASAAKRGTGSAHPGTGNSSNGASQTAPAADPNLADVFAVTESSPGVQILKDIPGASKPAKTINAAKLLLYGLQTLKQQDTATFEDVRAICKAHGFLDESNFSAYLKDDKESFILGGSARKKTLKLTVPGAKAAASLVTQLKSGS